MRVAFCSAVLHLLNPRLTGFAAFARVNLAYPKSMWRWSLSVLFSRPNGLTKTAGLSDAAIVRYFSTTSSRTGKYRQSGRYLPLYPTHECFCAPNLMRGERYPPFALTNTGAFDFARKFSRTWQAKGLHTARNEGTGSGGPRLATVDEHQFREREVRRQRIFMRFLPAANFIEETRRR